MNALKDWIPWKKENLSSFVHTCDWSLLIFISLLLNDLCQRIAFSSTITNNMIGSAFACDNSTQVY